MGRRIAVSFGITKNLGNFESARFDARYEVDVLEDEDLEAAYEKAWEIVDEQVSSKLDEA